VRLDPDEAHGRLLAADHGVLATVHPERGVDAVPVCFALDAARVVVPIDVVKPKSSTDLQRRTNLDHDPRATLLVEGWDADDWSQLWWVRARLTRRDATDLEEGSLERLLREKYPPYRDTTFADLLVFDVVAVTGWAAADPEHGNDVR
jgi:PPOX class probable F420-dependent enzyme